MDIEITEEMMEAVALALLYREDAELALRKVCTKKLGNKEFSQLFKAVKEHPDFARIKDDVLKVEELGLTDDNLNTIMLQYNRMLQKAQFEGKFDVAARILKEIRMIKAIDNEQMKFEIVIKVEKEKES